MSSPAAHPESLSVAAFTGAGQPFELTDSLVGGVRCRVFRNAPRSLAQLYVTARVHDARVLAVMDGVPLTYAEVLAQAASLAGVLQAEGVGKGTHVGIAMRNRPEWLVAFIAITALGAVPVLVNSRGAAAELAYSVRYTRCRLLLADERCAGLIAQAGAAAELAGIVIGELPPGCDHWRRYADLDSAAITATLPVSAVCAGGPGAHHVHLRHYR